jgi:UDP-2,4-diacetamido-2,4,6-trideoxy-beta-L-altropyranose hydrolase
MGTGHFMRCLTLADILAQRGAHCAFLCRELPAYLQVLLQRQGHELHHLPAREAGTFTGDLAHSSWLSTDQMRDAADCLQILKEQLYDWLVVDHYALDHRWETPLRQRAERILVIDDLADRRHDCDLLLDQNLYQNMPARYADKVPQHCRMLLGPKFALLREEFRQSREALAAPRSEVRRVLVFFGGIDLQNFTGQALSALAESVQDGLEVDVVLGAQHPERAAIELLCQASGYHCHIQTARMAELMASADLAIGAGGTATWERCSLGLPTLALSIADNQTRQLSDAAAQCLVYAPEVRENVQATVALHLKALLHNSALRAAISNAGMAAVDGLGAQRLALLMGCSGVILREARAEDSEHLYLWRNHPSIRAISRNREEIIWAEHNRWFTNLLADPGRKLLIGQKSGVPVGVVRFDIEGDQAEVSIYLVPDVPATCRGGDLLRSAEDWLVEHCREVRQLHAQVMGGNTVSKGLFMAAGYTVDNTLLLKELHAL